MRKIAETETKAASATVAPKAAVGQLVTNAALRTEVKRVLSRLVGLSSAPRLRWYLERADGDYDAPGPSGIEGGAVVSAEALEGRRVVKVLIEEVQK